MKRNLLLLILTVFYLSFAFSQTLYTSTNAIGQIFSPGSGARGTPVIMLDDVLIPSTQVAGTDSISITLLKFGIARLANAPATTVTAYYSVRDDTATLIPNIISAPPTPIGSIDLPANGANNAAAILEFGDSVASLFNVKTDTGGTFIGYQTIFIGLSFSGDSPAHSNSWLFTQPGTPNSDNKNFIWLYDDDATPPRSGGSFGTGGPAATFYLEVFGKGTGTLPVALADFSARRSGKVNIINWNTQEELNASHFIIERSSNGRNYSGIGQVNVSGNTGGVHHYTFTDEHPGRGINYYRLRIVDKDNSFKLSNIHSIRNEGIADINIYPNPVTEKLSVTINADKATDGFITITDLNGKVVFTKTIKLPQGNSRVPVMVNRFSAGSYIMKIQLNDDVVVKKFTKQ